MNVYSVFFIPYPSGPPGGFVVFGSTETGVPALHLYTDPALIEKTRKHMPPVAACSEYNTDALIQLIENLPYTHVCLNQDTASIVTAAEFVAQLSADRN